MDGWMDYLVKGSKETESHSIFHIRKSVELMKFGIRLMTDLSRSDELLFPISHADNQKSSAVLDSAKCDEEFFGLSGQQSRCAWLLTCYPYPHHPPFSSVLLVKFSQSCCWRLLLSETPRSTIHVIDWTQEKRIWNEIWRQPRKMTNPNRAGNEICTRKQERSA